MPTFGIQDIRFLLSRVRGEWLPEEQGGLAPLGPTGIRDVQGVGNATVNPLAPNWWFGAADTLFPRLTFNRLLAPGKKNDVISAPFANSVRGPDKIVTLSDTTTVSGKTVDALNPRNISNLIADSSNPVGFQSLNPADANYSKKQLLKLQDNPVGRVSPISGAINPLPYSNWMSQFGQFFDHGLDFVSKGVDGSVAIELMPSDPLYNSAIPMGPSKVMFASRSNTVNVTIGEGSSDALITKLGLDAHQGQTTWSAVATLTNPGTPDADGFTYVGNIVLNNTLIHIGATDAFDLARQLNQYAPTTGITVTVTPFAEIPGVVAPGTYQLTLTPADGESFNQASPFVDLSQNYGSDNSRTVFLREYITPTAGQTVTDITTGRLLNAGKTVNGETAAGVANWAQVKANALKLGITLHDADVKAIPLVAFDEYGQMVLDANGLPQLVALNKVTGEIVYVKDTNVAPELVLMTTKHAFLNDMGVQLPALTDPVWSGRDLVAGATKTTLEAHYVSGDGRMNENIGLTAVHEVFLTEHNRVLTLLKQQYGFGAVQPNGGWDWTDPLTGVATKVTGEELFQQAKLVLEMEYQHMVFAEFARKLSPNIAAFAAVNPAIDARISSEFANAVYRLGHSMLPEAIGMRQLGDATQIATTNGSANITLTLANHGFKTGDTITISSVDQAINGIAATRLNGTFQVTVVDNNTLRYTASGTGNATGNGAGLATDKVTIDINRGLINAFLSPQSYTPGSTSALLAAGSSAQVGMRIDEKVTDALRDNLLGQPLDLATLNLVRGRDAGIPTLNEMRQSIQAIAPVALQAGLNPYTSWTAFRNNLKGAAADQAATVKNFMMAYASDDILTKFAATGTIGGQAGRSLANWYVLRESTVLSDQQAYMSALKAATDLAYANATWMGVSGNKDFNRIDAWIGGLAEKEVVGGMLGSTFDAVFAMQMLNLQNGDNFYYLGRVPGTEFFNENIDGSLLSDLVSRSTGAKYLYGDIFSVADKTVDMNDVGQPAAVNSLTALQRSTTTQTGVFDVNGNVINASIGRAGYVNGTFYGNPGNYLDARGVLNPNGVGNASETIIGTANADVIRSGGGNDTVWGEGGNDNIDGGTGVDYLHGGDGDDTIAGGTDGDFMYGEAGNDTMRGNAGLDQMFGGDGNDTMYGGIDADLMIGGTGNDTMYGGDGVTTGGILDPEPAAGVALVDDVMFGGQGDDTMYGGGGWDRITGESGHDILIPGAGGNAQGGRETLNGGEGDDVYIIESGANLLNTDIADTGLTQEQLVNKGTYRTGNGLAIDEVRITQAVAGDIIIAGTNNLGVASVFTGVERVVITTSTAVTTTQTTAGVGTAAINVDASLANPGLNVGLEIIGNAGVNSIIGTIFNDKIDGGIGADTMDGRVGDDIYVVDNVGDVVIEVAGGGTDTVQLNANFAYVLGDEIENLTLLATALTAQATGNALDNVITGNVSNNTLIGLDGNDTIFGDAGADRIIGGAGIDTMTGGAGADTFVFENVADIGNDPLFIETITDFAAEDRFDFNAIDANVNATGNQAFTYIGSSAFSAAGQIRYAGGILSGDVNGDGTADFQIALTGSPTISATNFAAAAPANLTINGTAANETLSGGAGNDTINGLAGDDTLNGLAGNDTLDGGAGNDTLNGGDGTDILIGGAGIDSMDGGLGVDTFRFGATVSDIGLTAGARDVILNFQSGTDRIDLNAIDANTGQLLNQAFTWRGNNAFSAPGQLRYTVSNGVGLLEGNVTGTSGAEFVIELRGTTTLVQQDIIL